MKTVRSSTLSALFCLATAALVLAQAPATTATVAGATNFICLDTKFASGGVTTADAFGTLKQLGYRTIINLQTATEPGVDLEAEAKAVSQAGLKYLSLPFSTSAPDLTAIDKFLEVVKDPASQPVYIHCRSGQRANAFWMIKRVLVDGWTTEKAAAEADALKMTNKPLRDFVVAYLKDRVK
jgi:uncharacterized protein (TIGR01244 family)